jgi:integrase
VGKLIRDLLPDDWTMHTLRHRFGTRLYAHTKDLLMVQNMLGHATPTTTRRYVEYGLDEARAALDELAS